MKRIAFVLALVMLLSVVLTACVDTGNTSEGDVSSTSSNASDDDTSKEKLPPVHLTAQYCTNVSLGCSYTPSEKAGDAYEDSYGSELTDGLYSPSIEVGYTDAALSGYSPKSTSVSFVIDLGSVYDKLYQFEASYLCYDGTAGIRPPERIMIYASEDNETFEYCGKLTLASGAMSTTEKGVLKTDEYITARYIKFVVYKASSWVFLDELSVYADVEGSEMGKEYVTLLNTKYEQDTTTSESRLEALNSVAGDEIDYTQKKQLISKGCKYTKSSSAVSKYPDTDGKMLTDGNQCGYLAGETWVGFDGNTEQSFVVDLKDVRTDLAEFTASLYINSGLGNYYPPTMTVLVSSDDNNYVEIGKVYACDDITQSTYVYRLVLSKAVTARYVKFVFDSSESELMMIEELGVYAYTDADLTAHFYPTPEFEDGQAKAWPSSADYSKKQNLLRGLTQQILSSAYITPESYQYNTPVTAAMLTDGVYASGNNIHNGQYFKFNRGAGRTIFFDFGYLTSVETVKVSFLSFNEQAVNAPGIVTILMSEDGKTWYQAAQVEINSNQDQQTRKAEYTFERPIATRYIAYKFAVQTWAGCDELEAIGTKSTASAVRLANAGIKEVPVVSNGYQNDDPNLLGGVRDISLMYHGPKYDNTTENLLPYVAYLDKDGKITDTMFDGFLFLLTQQFPSGAAGHQASTKSDWEWCLNDLFAEGENIDALNTVAGQVNEALGLNKKYSFFVTLYVPHLSQEDFGDIDGDGVSESFAVYENRVKALNWYMDAFEKRLKEANYENLSFEGYYWYNESVYVNEDRNIVKLLNEVSDSIHNRGYDFFWIPYFNASGFSNWASFGFDTACLQPNYAFRETVIESRLDDTVNLIKQFNMSIEIECDDMAFTKDIFYKKYMGYLAHGVTDGYMTESMHMYYQGTSVYYKAAYSKVEKNRRLYDYTYQFIKGTLDISPDAIETIEVKTAENTPAKGHIKAESAETYTLAVAPEHGTVAISNNGMFTYYPDKGYTGSDTFSYTYNAGLGESELCQVNITVG